MSKVLALDVGTKRTGIAETDTLRIIASGLCTIETERLLSFLEEHMKTEEVGILVVGQPQRLHGESGETEVFIQSLIEKIRKKLPELKIERQDERFTSKMASAALLTGGASKKKRREKGLVDQVSATLILQAWLDRQ